MTGELLILIATTIVDQFGNCFCAVQRKGGVWNPQKQHHMRRWHWNKEWKSMEEPLNMTHRDFERRGTNYVCDSVAAATSNRKYNAIVINK